LENFDFWFWNPRVQFLSPGKHAQQLSMEPEFEENCMFFKVEEVLICFGSGARGMGIRNPKIDFSTR